MPKGDPSENAPLGDVAPNNKPYESVWDYPRPPSLEPVDFKIEVSHQGVVVASSTNCYRVVETSQPPAYYIPANDVAVEVLRPSTTKTFCEWKGMAGYADVEIEPGTDTPNASGTAFDAAWTYPDPTGSFVPIRGYWAFYAQKLDRCTVDDEVVDPNDGRFYGGWITTNITGPFKGGPGTAHW